jgi:hypothetical protein
VKDAQRDRPPVQSPIAGAADCRAGRTAGAPDHNPTLQAVTAGPDWRNPAAVAFSIAVLVHCTALREFPAIRRHDGADTMNRIDRVRVERGAYSLYRLCPAATAELLARVPTRIGGLPLIVDCLTECEQLMARAEASRQSGN